MTFKPNKKFILAIILGFVLIFTSCSAIFRPSEKKKESEDTKKEPPNDLIQMVDETDKIITSIEKVQEEKATQLRDKEEKDKESDQEQKSKEQEKSEKEQKSSEDQEDSGEQKGEEGNQQDKGKQEKKQNEENKKKKKAEIDWTEMDDSVKKLHEKWNSFEPEARKANVTESTVTGFEEQLNTLTEQIIARNEENTLVAANKLYSFYSNFLNLYKHMQPPEVKEVKYLVRQILINGQRDEWEDTEELIKDMEKSWEIAKARMNKTDKKLNAKIDLAIEDFIAVAREQKINLVKIKGDLLVKNLDQVK